MKVLLINDNSDHPNWGAQATPYALKRIIGRVVPGADITSLSWDWLRQRWFEFTVPSPSRRFTTPERHGSLWRLAHRLTRPVEFYPEIADDFDRAADAWLAGDGGPDAEEFIRLARGADLVVYNGENSIYRNTREGCHGLFLLWLAKTRLAKPSCLVNHTAHLNEVRPVMNAMVQLVASQLDLVAVRETRSLKNLHEMDVDSAVLYPDVVFAEDPAEHVPDTVDRWRNEVGLGDQPYFCLSASGLPVSAPSGKHLGAVGELVGSLQQLGLQAVLLARDPHCQFLGEVAERTGSFYFGPEHHFTELWPLFRSATFSVTGHFHYMIMGSSVGCPFIPMTNNNHKVSGVCELLEWHRTTPFDATWLRREHDEILNEARYLVDNQNEFRNQLVQRSTTLRADARALGERLREIATGGTTLGSA